MGAESEETARASDWKDLFRCFRVATDPAKVSLGFLGTAFTVLMLVLALFLFLEVMQLRGGVTSRETLEHLWSGRFGEMYTSLGRGVRITLADLRLDLKDIGEELFTSDLLAALGRANTLQKLLPWGIILLLLLWLPWAYFGGAVNRAAAVEYATGERLTSLEAREYAAARYSSYLWPPAILLIVIGLLFAGGVVISLAAAHVLSAAAFVVGAIGSLYGLVVVKQKTESSWTGWAVGLAGLVVTVAATWALWGVGLGWLQRLVVVLLFPLLIALALPAVLLFLILVWGWGYLVSTISFEGTDTFDAISRAGDYVLRQPWRLAFYMLVGGVYFVPCAAFVGSLALAAFLVAAVAAWLGFGEGFVAVYNGVLGPQALAPFGAFLPGFLLCVLFVLLCGLVAGWCMAFEYTFWAIAYALVRRRVDLSDTSEIFVEAEPAPAPAPVADDAGPSEP